MTPRALIEARDQPMSGWQGLTSPAHWLPDDEQELPRVGALLICPSGRSEAWRALPAEEWELTGDIEPRIYREGDEKPGMPPERAGLRIELPGAQAIAVELVPIGKTCLAKVMRMKRAGEPAQWREVEPLDAIEGAWSVGEPLQLLCVWRENRLRIQQRNGTLSVDVPVPDGASGAPSALSLYVVKGGVSFCDFVLTSR